MPLTVADAAKMLGVSTAMVCRLCRNRVLDASKDTTGKWVIANDVLLEYILRKAGRRVALIAKVNNLHPETIRRWLREKKLQGTKEGRWIVKGTKLPKHRKGTPRRRTI